MQGAVGVNVVNAEMYAQYRAEMSPLLTASGGSFVVDVEVAQIFRAPEATPFNRLFTIRFPTRERLEAFFAAPEYLAIRQRLFDPSVSARVQLGKYDVD
jgi:uncharacterized protein (DUF1330 family)